MKALPIEILCALALLVIQKAGATESTAGPQAFRESKTGW
jgi:hypothetical protein